ncbi:MAG: FAD-dependent oxidoreductase, partial [Chloroflexi bacterium]|nr:FAD-dependent oxidoreductase [Chloroflexota bacterium]
TYQIPYRSLLPQRVANLLAVGRCISVDHRAHHATKEIPACFATGEAAGIAAVLSLRRGVAPPALDVRELQMKLRAAGAWLPGS